MSSELVAYEQAVFDLYGANHVVWEAHHHMLLLQLLSLHHGLLLSLQLGLVRHLLLMLLEGGTLRRNVFSFRAGFLHALLGLSVVV